MTDIATLEVMPSSKASLLGTLLPPKKRPPANPILELRVAFPPDPERIKAFHEVLHWRNHAHLAPTYLQAMAMPLYLKLLRTSGFPFSPLGLVHMSNEIRQWRPLPVGATWNLSCRIGDLHAHPKGKMFDFTCEAKLEGELYWQAKARNLVRLSSAAQNTDKTSGDKTPPAAPEYNNSNEPWDLPADMGRRYGKASGDLNPIHLYPWSAKLFGFKLPIAHGMYSLGRCLSALELPDKFQADVTFMRPVMLPKRVLMQTEAQDPTAFAMTSPDSSQVYLKGNCQSLD